MRLLWCALAVVFATTGEAAKTKFKDYWNKFCGPIDCYSELGLFPNATKVQIKRAYRTLSLENHPDKNPGNRTAADKFRRVARANEVLSSDEDRKKLDYYAEHPAEYYQLYGSYLEAVYAPKSSPITVLVFLTAFVSCVLFLLQRSKWEQYCAKMERAAMMKLPVRGGGTPQSLELRARADELLQKEGKKKDKERLKAIVQELIQEMDVPAEYKKPKLSELLIVKIITKSYTYASLAVSVAKIEWKKLQKQPLTEDEKQIAVERALGGADKWELLTDDEQDDLLNADCYLKQNLDTWLEAHPAVAAKLQDSATDDTALVSAAAAAPKKDNNLTAKSKKELRQRRKAGNAPFVMED